MPSTSPRRYGVAVGDNVADVAVVEAAVVTVRVAHGEATVVAVTAGLAVAPPVGVSTAPDAGVAVAASAPVGLPVTVGQSALTPVPDAPVGVAAVDGEDAGFAAKAVAVLRAALSGVEARTVWTGGTALPDPAPQAVAVIMTRLRTPPRQSLRIVGRNR